MAGQPFFTNPLICHGAHGALDDAGAKFAESPLLYLTEGLETIS
jgi:hypothetical protein